MERKSQSTGVLVSASTDDTGFASVTRTDGLRSECGVARDDNDADAEVDWAVSEGREGCAASAGRALQRHSWETGAALDNWGAAGPALNNWGAGKALKSCGGAGLRDEEGARRRGGRRASRSSAGSAEDEEREVEAVWWEEEVEWWEEEWWEEEAEEKWEAEGEAGGGPGRTWRAQS